MIAAVTFILGAILLLLSLARYREFFSRKASVVDPRCSNRLRRAEEELMAGMIVGYDGSDGAKAALRAAAT